MENISPRKMPSTPGMPLFPVSPERMNASKQPVPQSPSLPAFTSQQTYSPHSSPTHQKNADVHSMVARFNALDIKDHHELRRRDEAALKRAQMGREQAEEDCRRYREEARALRKDVEEGRERERRVAKRVESVMEQLHGEKEKTASMQKTYEREIRRARKEAFKSSSALLETQKELKVTKAALNAAKVNLEKWVIPDGDELKARAEGVEMELSKALRLVEHMKMECQFGVCSCKLAEMNGGAYAADSDEQIMELMQTLKPTTGGVIMDEQPPAYEEQQREDSVMEDTPTPAPDPVDEKRQHHSTTPPPRRSSTVQPPGDMMIFSPNSGTFHRSTTNDDTPRAQQERRHVDDKHVHASNAYAQDPSTATQDFANNDEPTTPTTPATSVQGFSPKRQFPAMTDDEQEEAEIFEAQQAPAPEPMSSEQQIEPADEPKLPLEEEEDVDTVDDIDETLDEDDDPLESPTAHIRATTSVTTVPLAPVSSPTKPTEDNDLQAQDLAAEEDQPLAQPDFEAIPHNAHVEHLSASIRNSRATTPMTDQASELIDSANPRARVNPTTPKLDTNLPATDMITPAPKSAGDENILSATPWENHASTPLTRDEAIAMLRARRGRARSNAAGTETPGAVNAGSTPKRSASHGQGLGRKAGATTPGRRDISTVSAPDLGGRTPGGRKR